MINYLLEHFLEVISIIVALIIFYLQLRRKSLVYSIITNSNVISVSDKVIDAVQVLYKGTVVSNVRLIEIKISNKGNLAIKPDDYSMPLNIQFPDESKILSLEIIDPNSLGVQTNIEKSNIGLSNILLNPKDFFGVKLLIGNTNADILIRGRIVGVPKIKLDSSSTYWDTSVGFSNTFVFFYVFWFVILTVVNIFSPLSNFYDFRPSLLNLSMIALWTLGFTLVSILGTIVVGVVSNLLKK